MSLSRNLVHLVLPSMFILSKHEPRSRWDASAFAWWVEMVKGAGF